MTFNPSEHLMQIKNGNGSSGYLPVAWRLVWFREQCPNGTIETEMVHLDLDRDVEEEGKVWDKSINGYKKFIKTGKGIAIFRATVKDGQGGIGTGTKQENAASFPDFIEKAETGSIGRALAALGYGTQFAPDFDEQHRIVDSPVDRSISNVAPNGRTEEAAATEQQIASITKLCGYLRKPVLQVGTFVQAKQAIQQLSAEYREAKEKSDKQAGKAS